MNKVQLGDGKEEGRTLDLISKCGGWPTEAACKAIATRRIVNSNLLLFESSPHRCPFKINCQNLSSMYDGAPQRVVGQILPQTDRKCLLQEELIPDAATEPHRYHRQCC